MSTDPSIELMRAANRLFDQFGSAAKAGDTGQMRRILSEHRGLLREQRELAQASKEHTLTLVLQGLQIRDLNMSLSLLVERVVALEENATAP